MNEIGGYLEMEHFHGDILHGNAIALNCGRNALAYIILAKKIKRIVLPYYMCDSVIDTCVKLGVAIRYYHIRDDFLPADVIDIGSDEWLYMVDYYGQIQNIDIQRVYKRNHNLILDNAQAYFKKPLEGVDTIYTCRKFFGVADGAFVYTDTTLKNELKKDKSYGRMNHLLGRFEVNASEFYDENRENNNQFKNAPIMMMSNLTMNLLHAIDYEQVKEARTRNFERIDQRLCGINRLKVRMTEGPFAYPLLLENGAMIRKKLIANKIYVPTLWPNVLHMMSEESLEYHYVNDLLPLPCDQRYGLEEMDYICDLVEQATD